jgi:NADPH-dependent ferric siderophore reductase
VAKSESLIPAWRQFDVRVSRLERLSPSFLRVTFTGDDLDLFADNGDDQRFKVLFPQWRTYTVRAVRPSLSEVDVDMVLHAGGGGPASCWLREAAVGDELALIGPDVRHEGVHGGVEFEPPPGTTTVVLAGDETAAPAIASIVERLPEDLAVHVFVEVPCAEDFLPLRAPAGARIQWHARGDGQRMVSAVKAVAVNNEGLYAWLAGEASFVTTLRRHFVRERGLDKSAVTFMGYWRRGVAEGEEQPPKS